MRANFARLLSGVDRRSIGRSNEIAAQVLAHPANFARLIDCLWSEDRVVRMRTADALEKISVQRPELLKPYKAELLGLAAESTEAEVRWHLALILPRLALGRVDKERAVRILREYLNDPSSIVKTFAIQGLTELAQDHAKLQQEMIDMLEEFSRTGTPAMRARSRKLLNKLQLRS